jgi:hypothetical protein
MHQCDSTFDTNAGLSALVQQSCHQTHHQGDHDHFESKNCRKQVLLRVWLSNFYKVHSLTFCCFQHAKLCPKKKPVVLCFVLCQLSTYVTTSHFIHFVSLIDVYTFCFTLTRYVESVKAFHERTVFMNFLELCKTEGAFDLRACGEEVCRKASIPIESCAPSQAAAASAAAAAAAIVGAGGGAGGGVGGGAALGSTLGRQASRGVLMSPAARGIYSICECINCS